MQASGFLLWEYFSNVCLLRSLPSSDFAYYRRVRKSSVNTFGAETETSSGVLGIVFIVEAYVNYFASWVF